MCSRFLLGGLVLCCSIGASASGNELLTKLDRTIVREPKYENRPRYTLLVFGDRAQQLIWMVEDGQILYIDRNANRDLTDDGPIQATNLNKPGLVSSRLRLQYVLTEFGTADSFLHKDFSLHRWNNDAESQDSYGLSLSVDGAVPMYSGWFNAFWAATPKEAPVFHFAAPLTPHLLRSKEFVIGRPLDRLSICFANIGLEKADATRLSIDSLPAGVTFEVDIDWPVAQGSKPLKTRHTIHERCCYWEFYTTTFRAPAEAVPGSATVTVHVPIGFPLPLATNQFQVPVVANATKAD
ncbi:hypothetical protein Pan44_41850 [Caulifigura coniformis]|uniref:Intracellular proteinase inhibitor BsuPI domain-containing protein n=1 Tax=Caulifigura coniformis TaxID=2527983 RepID=A0A517SJ26_9PLAN|nr:hypothetical protein [Caulifigura coniformis]QDT56134.1 hypothetical protein Pan44_41850 [Caulifigura coniformis]